MFKTNLLALACVAVTSCAVSKVDQLSIPLVYKTNPKNAGTLGGLSCGTLAQVYVRDPRSDKTLGVRVHESKPLKADVQAASDPSAWARDGVQGLLTQNGVTMSGSGPALLLSLDTLHTTESIWHRSSYSAQLSMTGWLQSASGQTCWQGSGSGTGGNYGYTGSLEDYEETLNDALDAATTQMSLSAGFKDAICRCGR